MPAAVPPSLASSTTAQEFVSIVEERRFEKGAQILKKGNPGRNFYIIRSGNVSIADEQLVERKILGPFEYFGEEVRCAEPFFCVLAALGKTDLFRTHEVPRIKAVLETLRVF